MELRRIVPVYEDKRGAIADVFYKHQIDHVAVIDTLPGSMRGNHYHKQSTQHVLVTKGSFEYWYRSLDSREPAQCVVLREFDLVTTPPGEVHAMRMTEANQFIVFSEGLRGGQDYEADTFRTEPIIPEHLRF